MALENSMLVIDGNQIGGRTEDMTPYQTKADNSLQTTAKEVVDAINEVNAEVVKKADLTDLAPAFSTSTAYAVGQYVSYDGNIYKCTSAHSAGAWVAGDFTLVAVGSELREINSNLTNLDAYTTKHIIRITAAESSYTFNSDTFRAGMAFIQVLTRYGVFYVVAVLQQDNTIITTPYVIKNADVERPITSASYVEDNGVGKWTLNFGGAVYGGIIVLA